MRLSSMTAVSVCHMESISRNKPDESSIPRKPLLTWYAAIGRDSHRALTRRPGRRRRSPHPHIQDRFSVFQLPRNLPQRVAAQEPSLSQHKTGPVVYCVVILGSPVINWAACCNILQVGFPPSSPSSPFRKLMQLGCPEHQPRSRGTKSLSSQVSGPSKWPVVCS
ncbi:hypothetical protein LZ30DRAFT_364750 [Colletotrichum cereale]|nr:hypothetical protein LZ30DRAFT_364750 [Colletotrichum cereale]